MLQFQRDLDFTAHLDRLGLDEFWCGEHHSSGWEMIASPEMFLAAAGQRTHRIMLGTGVVSLPYHHPFGVAQRMVQLDHMTGGRAMFGSGPGALPSDAHTYGIDPVELRDRQDEALGVVLRLLAGEPRFSYECDWFTMRDAQLQLLPLQEQMPAAVASMISPSGMTLAGKHGTGVLSIGSMSTDGIQALPMQWSFAEQAAAEAGRTVDRRDWRVVMSWHLAETREQAREEAKHGLMRWHNEYIVGTLQRPGAVVYQDADEAIEQVTGGSDTNRSALPSISTASAIVGTPDDLIEFIRAMQQVTGGFGTLIGFAHDWANPEATFRSWDLLARYVVPAVNGFTTNLTGSMEFVAGNRAPFERAATAIMNKIGENERAAAAFAATQGQANGDS